MIEFDEDALICDLAETYHIYDYRSLPVQLVATLSAGLRDTSRIKMVIAEVPASHTTLLLATIADRIEAIRYGFTEDASSGKNPPVSLVGAIFGEKPEPKGETSFATPEEFEEALARIIGE